MLTNAYIFHHIEKSRAFVVIFGFFGLPKRKILLLWFTMVSIHIYKLVFLGLLKVSI